MGTRLGISLLYFMFIVAGLGNCSTKSNDVSDIAQQVGEYQITISDESQACRLSFVSSLHSGSVQLLPSPPCHFVLDWQGKVKNYRYEDLGPGVVAIVIGTKIHDQDEAYKQLAKRNDCGAQIQGIVFRSDGVFPLPEAHDAVRCADNGVDEKEFWSLTH